MTRQEVTILNAHVVLTGADGGHAYLTGKCEYEGQIVSVVALMVDKTEEAKLRDGDSVVSFVRSNYTPGAGLLISDCRLAKDT